MDKEDKKEEERGRDKDDKREEVQGREEGMQIIGEALSSETVIEDVERDVAPDVLGEPFGKTCHHQHDRWENVFDNHHQRL